MKALLLFQDFSGVENSLPEFLLAGFGLVLGISFLLGMYIYSSLAWQQIAKNANHKNPWLAWVPFGRTAMIFDMAGYSWMLVFLYLIPIIGWLGIWIMLISSMYIIFGNLGHEKWFVLGYALRGPLDKLSGVGTILYYITIGYVAWGTPHNKPLETKEKIPE